MASPHRAPSAASDGVLLLRAMAWCRPVRPSATTPAVPRAARRSRPARRSANIEVLAGVLKNPGHAERTNDEMAPASTRATVRAPTKWMPAGLAHDNKYVAHTTYPNSTSPTQPLTLALYPNPNPSPTLTLTLTTTIKTLVTQEKRILSLVFNER
jgi:hypothetical protein